MIEPASYPRPRPAHGQVYRAAAVTSLCLFFVALWLPSYTFVTPDHETNLHQIGFQSLLHPPTEIDYVVNGAYALVIYAMLRNTLSATALSTARVLLGILTALAIFPFMMGDRQPGSVVQFGWGAYLWLLALVVAFSRIQLSFKFRLTPNRT